MNDLNIPLASPSQQPQRLVRAIGFFLLVFVVSWLIVRLFIILDTTSWLRPTATSYSIHVPVIPSSIGEVTRNIGPYPLFSGNVWTIEKIPQWCQRSCSLHFDQNGSIQALTVDRDLPIKLQEQLIATGLSVAVFENKTLISNMGTEVESTEQHTGFSWSLLLPWNDAILIEHSQKTQSTIRINDRRIVIIGAPDIQEPHLSSLSKSLPVLAQIEIQTETIPKMMTNLGLPLSLLRFLDSLESQRLSIVVGDDAGAAAFSLQIPITIDQTQAATLSRELIKPLSLSTPEWTISDGSVLNEIVFDDEGITIETVPDQYGFYMEVLKDGVLLLRLTQTQSSLTISNHEISLNAGDAPPSSCLQGTRAFIRPGELLELLQTNDTISAKNSYPIVFAFKEVAFADKKVALCW